MKDGEASRTAEHMALFRAIESARPPDQRLFHDPLARAFLSRRYLFVFWLSRLPGFRTLVLREIDRRAAGSWSSAVARTRRIDDEVAQALERGLDQLVILGAGFDARAYRVPGIERLRVFEVDHPATSTRKRRIVERALRGLPPHVRFVETDFNQVQLEKAMTAAGYDSARPTLFLWEGVTNYLSADAVDATLRWCARSAPGNRVVFTYVDRAVLEDSSAFVGAVRLFAMLERIGERWTFGFAPRELAAALRERGLELEQDLGANDYRALYWGEAARKIRGYEFYRIAVARVAGPR